MKKELSKIEAQKEIEDFFKRDKFTKEELRKIRRLAMKYRIKLKSHRKSFCKNCLSQLKGKTRITKHYKTIICLNCNQKNRYKI